jgi:dipeptidyl aminopeptidase/acylaminoacyl peptidase
VSGALQREGEQAASAVRGAQRAALLGEALLHQSGAEADAATAYQQALALQPDNADALFGLAALADRAQEPEAQARWQQFLSVEPYGRRAAAVRLGCAVIGLTDLAYEEKQYAGWPELSPDGRHLVFQDRRAKALWLQDFPKGEQARTLTAGAAAGADWDPSWSPRGDWLLFRREQGAKPGLYVRSPFGGEARCLLAEEEGQRIRDPSWSPDGRRVLFRRSRDGLCLLDLASGKTRVLGGLKTGQFLFEPRFAPDGASLVASTYPDPKGVNITPETVVELGFVGDALQPKPQVQPLTSLGAGSRQPAPSPDGMRVAFACNAFDRRRQDLWLLDYRTPEAPVCVAPSLGDRQTGAFRPAWSPDGRQLVFPRDQRLWVATLGGLPAVPVHVSAETADGRATVTVRSFADQPLHLKLNSVWYDDNSVLLADNWDTPGEAVNLAPKGTQQVVLPFPTTQAPPVTLRVYLFDSEQNCVIRLFGVAGERPDGVKGRGGEGAKGRKSTAQEGPGGG